MHHFIQSNIHFHLHQVYLGCTGSSRMAGACESKLGSAGGLNKIGEVVKFGAREASVS